MCAMRLERILSDSNHVKNKVWLLEAAILVLKQLTVCRLFSEQYPIRLLTHKAYRGLSAANARIITNKRMMFGMNVVRLEVNGGDFIVLSKIRR
jgi:hypothetical protein